MNIDIPVQSASSKPRFQELDALRGIAALLVVFFHHTMSRDEAALGFKFGTTGVDLFFIISGFVITMSLSHVKSGVDFIINRITRLYPTYWACVTCTLILIQLVHYFWRNEPVDIYWTEYFANLSMFQYYLNFNDLDGPYWTMILELGFYAFMLLLFLTKTLKYMPYIGLLCSVMMVVLFRFYPIEKVLLVKEYAPFLTYIPLFTLGVLCYRIYHKTINRFSGYSLFVLLLICQMFLYGLAGRSAAFITQLDYIFILSIYGLLFGLFIKGKLEFIIWKPLLFLGKISFALYLIHQYLSIDLIIPALYYDYHWTFWQASLGVALPCSILLATLITFSVEIPLSPKFRTLLYWIKNRFYGLLKINPHL